MSRNPHMPDDTQPEKTISIGALLAAARSAAPAEPVSALTPYLADETGDVPAWAHTERALVGASFHPRVRSALIEASAHNSRARNPLCRAALAWIGSGDQPSVAGLHEHLTGIGFAVTLGQVTELCRMPDDPVAEGMAALGKVCDRHQMALIGRLGADLLSGVSDPYANPAPLLSRLRESVGQIERDLAPATDPATTAAAYVDYVLRERPPRVSTGYDQWDTLTGGVKRGLHYIAARTSMGKTAFAISIAYRVCVARARRGCFYTFEMPRDELACRLVAQARNLDAYRLMNDPGYMQSEGIRESAMAGEDVLRNGRLDIHERRANLAQLCADIRWRAAEGCKIFFIDQLNRISKPRGMSNEREFLNECSKTLQSLSVELGVCLYVLHQINRSTEAKDRGDRVPSLADLRDCAVEEDADTVTVLYRPWYHLQHKATGDTHRDYDYWQDGRQFTATVPIEQATDVRVLKNRNGPTGGFGLRFNRQCISFEPVWAELPA